MTERRCSECGEAHFMTPGDPLCKDCRRWEYEQSEAGTRARIEIAKNERERKKARTAAVVR